MKLDASACAVPVEVPALDLPVLPVRRAVEVREGDRLVVVDVDPIEAGRFSRMTAQELARVLRVT